MGKASSKTKATSTSVPVSIAVPGTAKTQIHSNFASMIKVAIQPKTLELKNKLLEKERESCQTYWEKATPVYCKSNIPANNKTMLSEHFYPLKYGLAGALWAAYDNHADVILSPDDVWITICHIFSIHVNTCSEKLRNYFVNHEGQKELAVVIDHAPLNDKEWDNVISLFHTAVKGAVKADTAKILECSFTTTGPIEKTASAVASMTTFQKYFTYVCYTRCGIRNVYFMGTLDDWKTIKTKLGLLAKFECEEWTTKLESIIDKFIETYQGKVDLEFWNQVVHIKRTGGSGASTKVSGWITNFYPYSGEGKALGDNFDVQRFPETMFSVPFILDDCGARSNYYLKTGFTGILYENEAFRPQLSYALFDEENQKIITATKSD